MQEVRGASTCRRWCDSCSDVGFVCRLREAEAEKSSLERALAESVEAASQLRAESLQLDAELARMQEKFGALSEANSALEKSCGCSAERQRQQAAQLEAAELTMAKMEAESNKLRLSSSREQYPGSLMAGNKWANGLHRTWHRAASAPPTCEI